MNNMHLTPAVRYILILNVACFVIVNLIAPGLFDYLALCEPVLPWYPHGDPSFRPYQVATYFFMHADLFHILFNMVFLVGIGSMLEMVIGDRRFLQYYLFCGVSAGVLLVLFDPLRAHVVGASTALSGVLAYYAAVFPNERLSIMFLPVSFRARDFAFGVALISAVFALLTFKYPGAGGGISHFGHLAGMLSGWGFGFVNALLSKWKR